MNSPLDTTYRKKTSSVQNLNNAVVMKPFSWNDIIVWDGVYHTQYSSFSIVFLVIMIIGFKYVLSADMQASNEALFVDRSYGTSIVSPT